jgi:tetratricopeptide (TPR) repeat protein
MKPHAFVAMPFGTKKDANGQEIDFNRVYDELLTPAVRDAGLEVFRADAETRAGDIRSDMFQELLMADLVVADLTIDNPNVWYEIGVRHALRARGVVIVSGGKATTAFDLYTDRKLRYGLAGGGPDPATLDKDRAALTTMVRATMESWHGRTISPVYNLLPQLQEPDWKSLRVGDVREFWEWHDKWEGRIDWARRESLVGDVLVLADEAPVSAFRADAWIKAGEALRKAEHFDFALEQLERGLEIEPTHLKGLREKGVCLQRLALTGTPGHSLDRARAHYRELIETHPNDAETWALAGRLDKDAWVGSWRLAGKTPAEMRDEAAYEDGLLRAAVESYAKGYRRSPGHYYSGINALTLMHLYRHLNSNARYDREMDTMAGAVRFAAECETDERALFWSKSTLGDLEVLVGTPETVVEAYKDAIVRNDKDWFALNSSRAQLSLLTDLGFRPETVSAGMKVFDRALQKLRKPDAAWQPRQVLLFSGHMVDEPGRTPERFPTRKEPAVAARIAQALEELGAGTEDLALTQGACGGDLLFTEACQQRGVKVQWLQPFDEPHFILESVVRGGESWRARYLEAKARLHASEGRPAVRSAPEALGDPPRGRGKGYAYERCNLWLLFTALASGVDKVRFVCVWNGKGGDGPGGTAHMYNEVKRRTGRVTRIDPETL